MARGGPRDASTCLGATQVSVRLVPYSSGTALLTPLNDSQKSVVLVQRSPTKLNSTRCTAPSYPYLEGVVAVVDLCILALGILNLLGNVGCFIERTCRRGSNLVTMYLSPDLRCYQLAIRVCATTAIPILQWWV